MIIGSWFNKINVFICDHVDTPPWKQSGRNPMSFLIIATDCTLGCSDIETHRISSALFSRWCVHVITNKYVNCIKSRTYNHYQLDQAYFKTLRVNITSYWPNENTSSTRAARNRLEIIATDCTSGDEWLYISNAEYLNVAFFWSLLPISHSPFTLSHQISESFIRHFAKILRLYISSFESERVLG